MAKKAVILLLLILPINAVCDSLYQPTILDRLTS